MNTPEPFPDLNTPPPLSDEAAAQILAFLQHWVEQFESHYYGQLRRYYEDPTPGDDPIDLFSNTDPPF
jgi:hypothetical protein